MQKTSFLSLLFVLSCSMSSLLAHAQANNNKPAIQTMLEAKQFLFTALYAQPLSGRQITLTSTYTLRLSGDSLVCGLPYYGRAYTVEGYPGGGGLDFISYHFDYQVSPAKRGRYTVSINIKDKTIVNQININVSKNGYASVQITPTNRQFISYYGNITEVKTRFK